jgi:LGFP repeat
MRAVTKRTASFSVAIAVFALVGAGCHQSDNKSSTSSSSAASSSAASTSAAAEPTTSAAAATPSPTQIAGKNGTLYTVEGPILAKWETLNDEQKKDLGAPYDNQKNTLDNSGVYQQYDDGVLIYKNGGPVYLVWGKIRDAWNAVHASQGKLGYPTSDETKEPDGSYKSTFEHGTATWKEGDDKAAVTTS